MNQKTKPVRDVSVSVFITADLNQQMLESMALAGSRTKSDWLETAIKRHIEAVRVEAQATGESK